MNYDWKSSTQNTSLSNEPLPRRIWLLRFAIDDQWIFFCGVALTIAIFHVATPQLHQLPVAYCHFLLWASGICFVYRLGCLIHFYCKGIVVRGEILSARRTAKGYSKVSYQYTIDGDTQIASREVVVEGDSQIWVLASPSNSRKHFVAVCSFKK